MKSQVERQCVCYLKKKKRKKTFLVFVPCAGEQGKKWKTDPIQGQSLKLALFCFEIVWDIFLVPPKLPVMFEKPKWDYEDYINEFMFGNIRFFAGWEGTWEITTSSPAISQMWKLRARDLDRELQASWKWSPGLLPSTPAFPHTFQTLQS